MIFIVLALVVRGKDFIFLYFHFTQGVWCSTISNSFSFASPLGARLYLGTDASLHMALQFLLHTLSALPLKIDLLLDCTVLLDCCTFQNFSYGVESRKINLWNRGAL